MRSNVQKNNISSMVEAGILSAIAVIFAAISIYIPMLGVFINIFWPVPLILLGVRHGLKWSALALLTSGILLAIIVSPLQSLVQVTGLGLIGLTLGFCLNKGKSTTFSLACGSIASLISKALVLALSFWVMGTNPLDFSPELIDRTIDDTLQLYRSFGMPEQELEQNRELITTILNTMKIIIPAGLVMASILDTYLNFIASRAILKRLGTVIPGLPTFKNWVFPQAVLFLYGFSLVVINFTKDDPNSIYYNIATNINIFFGLPILLQGVAVCWFIIEKKGWPNFLKGILVALLFLNGIVPFAILIAGMVDYIFDFRKIRPSKQ